MRSRRAGEVDAWLDDKQRLCRLAINFDRTLLCGQASDWIDRCWLIEALRKKVVFQSMCAVIDRLYTLHHCAEVGQFIETIWLRRW